jgi:DNA-binding phage protein
MNADDAMKGVLQAAEMRAKAARLRAEANERLRDYAQAAHAEGVPMSRIAAAAGLSRQGLYDLLADPQPV